MKTIRVEMTGTMPLLMHSQRGMNFKDPEAQQLSILNKKRGKTEEDRRAISEMEFLLGLYWDKARQCVYIPSWNVIRCIQDGGKKLKLGKKIIEGIRAHPTCLNVPLIYPSHSGMTLDGLKSKPEFWDIRTVTVSGTVERTRPRFDTWGLRPLLLMDEEVMSAEELQACLDKAGFYCGIGDFRVSTDRGGQYGTFTATVRAEEN